MFTVTQAFRTEAVRRERLSLLSLVAGRQRQPRAAEQIRVLRLRDSASRPGKRHSRETERQRDRETERQRDKRDRETDREMLRTNHASLLVVAAALIGSEFGSARASLLSGAADTADNPACRCATLAPPPSCLSACLPACLPACLSVCLSEIVHHRRYRYAKYGYAGVLYCKACSESFRSHLARTQTKALNGCSRREPCDHCSKVLAEFNCSREQVFRRFDNKITEVESKELALATTKKKRQKPLEQGCQPQAVSQDREPRGTTKRRK